MPAVPRSGFCFRFYIMLGFILWEKMRKSPLKNSWKIMYDFIWIWADMKASLSCCFPPEYLYDVFVLSAHDHNFSANILLDDQFQPKLTDFAMAHFRPHLEPQSSAISMTSSSSKHVWYMPEECIRQGKLSIKTDVYSFGIVSTNYRLMKEKSWPPRTL